jgi:hypothetical protein
MDTKELFEELKKNFPLCFFTLKGNKIKAHEGSMLSGVPLYSFTKFSFPYKLGVHFEFTAFLEEHNSYTEIKDGELVIKKEN